MEAQLGVKLYGDETFDEILEIQKQVNIQEVNQKQKWWTYWLKN